MNLWPLLLFWCASVQAQLPPPETSAGANTALLKRLYEACRIRQLQTGSFPTDFRHLGSLLSEEMRRRMPGAVEFHDPESRFNRLRRQSPIGERTPCLRVHLADGSWLNVSASGGIYRSGLYWETEFVDLMPRPFMNPTLLAQDTRSIPARAPSRSPRLGLREVDLVARCNAIPTVPWFYGPRWQDATGSESEAGEQAPPTFGPWISNGIFEHAGILFDVRGVIQLDGTLAAPKKGMRWIRAYPRNVAVPVEQQKAQALHLLAGTVGRAEKLSVIASLRLHFKSGRIGEVPLLYTQHIAAADDDNYASVRLYPRPEEKNSIYSLHYVKAKNPGPNEQIEWFEFQSGSTSAHPFLLSLTLEP